MFAKKLEGSVTVFVLIMLGFIIGLYLVGYSSPILSLAGSVVGEGAGSVGGGLDANDVLSEIGQVIMSPLTLVWLGISFLGAIVGRLFNAGNTGQGSVQATIVGYMIPCLLIGFVANIFFFPVIPTASASGMPTEASYLLTIVLNVLMLLAIISWVSGRD